jgi:hypothetical protein
MSVAARSLNPSPIRAAVSIGPADTGRDGVTILDLAADSSTAPFPTRGSAVTGSRTRYGHVAPAPRDVSAPRIQAAQLHDDLWRVTRPDGEVVGYVERFAESRGIRFRAKRLIVRQQRFVPIGEFWSMDDAMAVL